MSVARPPSMHIGFLVFPAITQLDMTGPLQVLSRIPGARVHLVWKTLEPVQSDTVLRITPTITFDDCPQLDIVCVPGGIGTDALLTDEETLAFLRKQATSARYVTSVCTGSLVLGAAGLLQGYRAATHWSAMDLLPLFGATATQTRVCVDRNRITGGGVTAGIDFGLTLAAELAGRPTAEAIQLMLEYDPQPPFNSGSPHSAPKAVLDAMRQRAEPSRANRVAAAQAAASRLPLNADQSTGVHG